MGEVEKWRRKADPEKWRSTLLARVLERNGVVGGEGGAEGFVMRRNTKVVFNGDSTLSYFHFCPNHSRVPMN